MEITLDHVNSALTPVGLLGLGGFNIMPDDGVPDFTNGSSLVLVGNAGPDMWQAFSSSGFNKKDPAPLDDWTRRVLNDITQGLSRQFDVAVTPLYPFSGPPYMPFQRWAARSGAVHPTPIGPMIHNIYGMWHAYRGALVIGASFEMDETRESTNPCQSCIDKPCLTSCPVDAFSIDGYDVPACLDLLEKQPDGECFSSGCVARKACPVGRDYIYEKPQARFHMEKFLNAHR
jgi:hypothetical protein